MATTTPHERDPKIWVKSKGGTWYWRHPTGSSWKGPRRDRVWVPSMDAPDWLPPPPDDFSNLDADEGQPAPAPAHTFGTVVPTVVPMDTTPGPGIPIPPIIRSSAFGSSGRPTDLWGSSGPPPARTSTYTTTGAVTYTGPYANTMRHRDESIRLDREREDDQRRRREVQADRDRREFERNQREREQRRREEEDRALEHRRFEGAQDEHQDYYHHGSSYRPEPARRDHHDYGRQAPRRDIRSSYSDTLHSGAHREEQRAQSHAQQDRAREQQLREKVRKSRAPSSAASSSGSTVTPTSVRPIPNVDAATLGNDGHPILPNLAPDDEESEYGGSDDSEEDSKAVKRYRTKESFRLGEARRKTGAEDPPAAEVPAMPDSIGAGIWARLPLNTVSGMRNLMRWMSAGCPKARAAFKYLREYYGRHPTAARSDGIQLMMREQAAAEKAWVYATTGDATPMSRRPTASGGRPAPTRGDRRKWKRNREGTPPAGPSAPKAKLLPLIPPDRDAPDRKVIEQDVPMPEAPAPGGPVVPPPPPPIAQPPPLRMRSVSYLGFSLPPEGELAASNPLGPAGDLNDVLDYMRTVPPLTWVRGIRLEDGTWPTADTPIGARPLGNDVLAARTINYLAPRREGTGSVHRTRFITEVLTGFSIPGLFEHYVNEGGYQRASNNIAEYPFDGQNFTLALGFVWVVMHGVWAKTPAARIIHEFARSWRNHRNGASDPTLEEFKDPPHNAGAIKTWPVSLLTRWEYIRHGPVRPGITTTALQVPSGYQPPAAVVHEEDAEMKDGDAPEPAGEELVAGTQIPLPDSPKSPEPHEDEEEVELNAGVTRGTTPTDSNAAKGNATDA
ncbi:hypothetical protein DFH06DRAFT_1319585 [Mycena polygramma]|nr:hypothetical protein DFH06DRAFT_1319585 [Mycena polygramma]